MGAFLMHNIIVYMITFSGYIFEGYCLQHIFNYFLQVKHNKWKVSPYIISIIWFLLRVVSSEIAQGNDSSKLIGKLIASIMVLLFLSFYCYVGNSFFKIFLPIIFISLHQLSFFAAYSLLGMGNYLYKIPLWYMERVVISEQHLYFILNIIEIILLTLMEVVQGFLLYLTIKYIMKSYRYKVDKFYVKELLYVLLPALAGVLVSLMLRLIMIQIENGTQKILYEKYPALHMIIPMISLLLLITIVVSFRIYQDMIGLQEEKSERAILENQIVNMQNSMVEMEHLYDSIGSVKHDMKNNIAVLQKMILDSNAENKEAARYFEDMCQSVERLDYRIKTGSPVSDVVINSKFRQAKKEIEDIELDACSFLFPKSEMLKAFDIAIILNNGLDNAIEACKRLRENQSNARAFISIQSFWKGKFYFIEIENSFDGVIALDERNGYPLSTKEDKEIHGIGLRNIRNCARKYFGDVDFIVENRKFILSVMLKNTIE